jgi:ribosomal protein S18 acetylase RimI-like enzyme
VSVRLAAPEDAPEVARLLAAFRDWFGRPHPPEEDMLAAVRHIMATERADYLLAGDPPAGVAQLRYRHSVWTGTDDCWLEDLYVEDHARGNGLGRALVEAAVGRARERGCARVELDVDEGNAAAQALYEAAGFRSSKRPGERVLFMQKRLAPPPG